MKSILLYANEDPGLESRLQAALDIVRASGGHLTCLHATPYHLFVTGDPFGGMYAMATVVEQLGKAEAEQRQRIEDRLAGEGVSWDWMQVDGDPAKVLVDRSALSDLVVVSLSGQGRERDGFGLSLAADVAVHVRGPLLAIPAGTNGFLVSGPMVVAWNGSPEAAHALRLALPMLRMASAIQVATVTEDRQEFPATEAAEFLARHGLASELIELPGGETSAGDALLGCARTLGASCIVMGAYGHSRLREAVLGGVTHHMMEHSPIALLLAH